MESLLSIYNIVKVIANVKRTFHNFLFILVYSSDLLCPFPILPVFCIIVRKLERFWEGKMQIWLATGNRHKKKELEEILAGALKNPSLKIKIPSEAGYDFDP